MTEDSKRKAASDGGGATKRVKEEPRTSTPTNFGSRRKPATSDLGNKDNKPPRVDTQSKHQTTKPEKTPKSYLGRTPKPYVYDDVVETVTYSPGELLPGVGSKVGKLLLVRIPQKYIVTTNKHLVARQLWGTDKYSDDSDMVAVIKHTGWFTPEDTVPPFHALQAVLRIHPPQEIYTSTARFGIKSRKWSQLDGWSFSIESVDVLETPNDTGVENQDGGDRVAAQARVGTGADRVQGQNSVGEFVPDIYRIQFNLSNEPCLKYSQGLVADRGMEKEKLTSYRLRTEALYLESEGERFELVLNAQAQSKNTFDTYRWSKVKNPTFLDRAAMMKLAVPLPKEHVEVIHQGLDWEDFAWGQFSVRVKGETIKIERIQFYKKHD